MPGGDVKVELLGVEEVERAIANMVRKVPEQVKRGLKEIAEEIMADSKENYVPVDDGVLRGSGKVGQPTNDFGVISVALGYGGDAQAYATALHEHPSGASPPSWSGVTLRFGLMSKAAQEARVRRGGEAGHKVGTKYLSRPVEARIPSMARDIVKAIDLNKAKR